MSTAELKEIVAENIRTITALRETQKETGRQMKETDHQTKETDRQLKERQKETGRQMMERLKETGRQMKESRKEVDRQLKELGKQIGGLGRKFGTFAEGLSYNSIRRILADDFKMNEFIAPAVNFKRDGREEEYDILAYSNGTLNQGMVVEVKSKLRQEDVDQMKRKMDEVFYWLPAHKEKTFFGMVAYVSGHAALKKQIIENGWYLAHIGDEIFEMETPEGFSAKGYASGEVGKS